MRAQEIVWATTLKHVLRNTSMTLQFLATSASQVSLEGSQAGKDNRTTVSIIRNNQQIGLLN